MKPATTHKYFPVVVLSLLLLLVWGWNKKAKDKPAGRPTETVLRTPKTADEIPGFNRHTRLVYTAHARCRMDCRQVTEAEVEEILAKGRVDLSKSNLHDKPCPTYALEGYSNEGQHLRIIFATCREATRVVTCIDLDKKWTCNCD
ncbi:DUF4258 domain-containing protein [uncultured Chitinophaga sp.]|mgnify:CR=1 FL=1|jgi:hypothetical protein|uniref:DUF4258 domain-containing protein n=1 Tax=uncultured Chitinophaga sp. TaxID=339340 RepID=UPI00262819DE|nr:DUF4258 domain-containing protein [uncultured Chitinophaga sp.]